MILKSVFDISQTTSFILACKKKCCDFYHSWQAKTGNHKCIYKCSQNRKTRKDWPVKEDASSDRLIRIGPRSCSPHLLSFQIIKYSLNTNNRHKIKINLGIFHRWIKDSHKMSSLLSSWPEDILYYNPPYTSKVCATDLRCKTLSHLQSSAFSASSQNQTFNYNLCLIWKKGSRWVFIIHKCFMFNLPAPESSSPWAHLHLGSLWWILETSLPSLQRLAEQNTKDKKRGIIHSVFVLWPVN